MKQNKKVYLIKVCQSMYEPCVDLEDFDIDNLPVVQTFIHESYETARKHVIDIIEKEYPLCHDYLFYRPNEEDEDYEPELVIGDFCTFEENPDCQERLAFKYGDSGNDVGPCMCIQNAELTKISITEETLLS